MKLAYFLPLILAAGCSTVPANVTTNEATNGADQATEASAASETSQKEGEKKGKYSIKQDYEFDDLLVHIGGFSVIPGGVWVGAYFENKSAQNMRLDLSGAYVDVDDQQVPIDMAAGDTGIISGPLSSESNTKGTLVFPVDDPTSFQSEGIKSVTLHLGKAYDAEGIEIADIEIYVPVQ